MPGFDPRQYEGRRVTEIVRTLNGDIRAALEEARAAYRLCLRHDRLAEHLKGLVRMHLWQVEKKLGLHARYFSQAGQDRYLDERIFRSKRNGTFVEIGGYDGWMGSNCVFFEKVLGWTGLVVEASPQFVQRIGETRSAEVVHAAVSDRDGTAEFLEVTSGLTQMGGLMAHYPSQALGRIRRDKRHAETVVTVPATRLDTLLRARGLEQSDYCSIDVEGAERAVLRSIDFDEFDIAALSIENNRSGPDPASYEDVMAPAGYRQAAVLGMDEIWVKGSG